MSGSDDDDVMWVDEEEMVEIEVRTPPVSTRRGKAKAKPAKRSVKSGGVRRKPKHVRPPVVIVEEEEEDEGEAAFLLKTAPSVAQAKAKEEEEDEDDEPWVDTFEEDDDEDAPAPKAEAEEEDNDGEAPLQLPGTTGDNQFDAGGVSAGESIIPVGGGCIAQLTHANGAGATPESSDRFLEFVASGKDTCSNPPPAPSISPDPNGNSTVAKHAAITQREISDLAQRRVAIRNHGVLAGGQINRETIDPFFKEQLKRFKGHSNVVFRNAASVLEEVLFTKPGEKGEGSTISVDRAADAQLFLSQDCHVELLLKILKSVTKSPFNWLNTPHDISLLNSYAIVRDRKTLLSLARTPGNGEPVPVCPNGKQCASRFLQPPFPRGKLPVSDLELNQRFGGDTPHPCVFCASYYNATITTMLQFLGTPVPSFVVISRVQPMVDGPYGVSRDLVMFPRIPCGNLGGVLVLPRRGHCLKTNAETGSVSWSHPALVPRAQPQAF